MPDNDKPKMREIVEQYYSGNFQMIIDNVTDTVTWTSHNMSNVQLKNKQELIEFLQNVPLGRFTFENKKFILEANNVVVEGVCHYNNKGRLIENFYCDIYTFNNNKIEKVSSYFI